MTPRLLIFATIVVLSCFVRDVTPAKADLEDNQIPIAFLDFRGGANGGKVSVVPPFQCSNDVRCYCVKPSGSDETVVVHDPVKKTPIKPLRIVASTTRRPSRGRERLADENSSDAASSSGSSPESSPGSSSGSSSESSSGSSSESSSGSSSESSSESSSGSSSESGESQTAKAPTIKSPKLPVPVKSSESDSKSSESDFKSSESDSQSSESNSDSSESSESGSSSSESSSSESGSSSSESRSSESGSSSSESGSSESRSSSSEESKLEQDKADFSNVHIKLHAHDYVQELVNRLCSQIDVAISAILKRSPNPHRHYNVVDYKLKHVSGTIYYVAVEENKRVFHVKIFEQTWTRTLQLQKTIGPKPSKSPVNIL